MSEQPSTEQPTSEGEAPPPALAPTPAPLQAIPIMVNCDGADVEDRATPDGSRVVFLKLYAAGGLVLATFPMTVELAKALAARLDQVAGPRLTAATLADLPPRGARP